jgi:hypothetical protein
MTLEEALYLKINTLKQRKLRRWEVNDDSLLVQFLYYLKGANGKNILRPFQGLETTNFTRLKT